MVSMVCRKLNKQTKNTIRWVSPLSSIKLTIRWVYTLSPTCAGWCINGQTLIHSIYSSAWICIMSWFMELYNLTQFRTWEIWKKRTRSWLSSNGSVPVHFLNVTKAPINGKWKTIERKRLIWASEPYWASLSACWTTRFKDSRKKAHVWSFECVYLQKPRLKIWDM